MGCGCSTLFLCPPTNIESSQTTDWLRAYSCLTIAFVALVKSAKKGVWIIVGANRDRERGTLCREWWTGRFCGSLNASTCPFRPKNQSYKQTGMEAIEGLRFLASFDPLGTGKRKRGEKTQPFHRFHSYPGKSILPSCYNTAIPNRIYKRHLHNLDWKFELFSMPAAAKCSTLYKWSTSGCWREHNATF